MSAPTRRTVLGGGLGLVGLAVVGAAVEAPAADAATAAPARSQYDRSVGKVFTVRHAGHSYRLTLTSVQALPHATKAQRQACFSLQFAQAKGTHLPDGIYSLVRAGVPTHALFLSRVGTAGALQAVVNRAH